MSSLVLSPGLSKFFTSCPDLLCFLRNPIEIYSMLSSRSFDDCRQLFAEEIVEQGRVYAGSLMTDLSS